MHSSAGTACGTSATAAQPPRGSCITQPKEGFDFQEQINREEINHEKENTSKMQKLQEDEKQV
jgi:DNA-binding winged helix-turn-helix (wHTH) protein